MIKDESANSEGSAESFEELSNSENPFGIKLDKSKPIGLLGALVCIVVSLFFLLKFILSPTVGGFILATIAWIGAAFSAIFRVSEKEFEQGKKKTMVEFSKRKEKAKEFDKTQEYNEKDAKQIAKGMRHKVNPKILRRKKAGKAPLDRLDDGEKLQYFLTGFDLDIDDNDEGHQSQLIVTDKKVVMIATSITAKTSQYTVSFSDIVGLSVQQRATSHIRIQTAGPSYKISVANSSNKLAADVVEFIRRRKDKIDTEIQEFREKSIIDELEKLADLRDRGILTKDEFNAKKQNLMNEI